MAAPTQEFPPWLTASEIVDTDAAGVPTATRTTVLYLPLTYLGPSIPLGEDFTFGGTTYPPTIVTGYATSTPTIEPSSPTATPPTTTTAIPSFTSSSSVPTTSSTIVPSSSTLLPSSSTTTSPSSTTVPPSSTTLAPTSTSSSTDPTTSTTESAEPAPTNTSMSSASRGRLVGAIVSGILILLFLFVILLAAYLYFKGRARRRRHAYSPTSVDAGLGPGMNYYSSGSFTSGEYAILSDDEVVRSKEGAERLKLIGGVAGGATDGRLTERSPRQSGEEGDTLLRPSATPPLMVGGQLVQAPQQMQQLPTRRPIIDTSMGAVGVARNLSSSSSSATRSPVKRVPVPPLEPTDSSEGSSRSNPSIPPQPSGNLSELGVPAPSSSSNGQVQGNTQNSHSSSGSSRPSTTTDYGTLLERPRFQFGFGGLGAAPSDQEYRQSGQRLNSDEMRRLNANESVLPEEASGSDDRYSGAYALSRDHPAMITDPEGIFGGGAARQRTDSNEEEFMFGNVNPNLPPPRLVTREQRPRDSVGSYPSIGDAEDAALMTAHRVRVGSPEDRALAGESGSSGSGILGAIGLSGLSWFGGGGSNRNTGSDNYSPIPSRRQSRYAHTPSPSGSFSAVPVYDPYDDLEIAGASRQHAAPPPPVARPGLLVGLTPDGTRPSSHLSTTSASGVTIYHDAASSLPGTPALAVPARAMTPGDVPPPSSSGHFGSRTPPPVYEEFSSSQPQQQQQQRSQTPAGQRAMDASRHALATNVDILDLPAPSALINHSHSTPSGSIKDAAETGTVSSVGLSKYPVPPGLEFLSTPPGLGLVIGGLKTKDSQDMSVSSATTASISGNSSPALPWGYTRSPLGSIRENAYGVGTYDVYAAREGLDDLLEDAPPGAQEGWRSMASARSGGQAQVPVSARRPGSGFSGLPQYHHPSPFIPSEHGSLHSMRSHINPPSVRSTGSAAAASTINSGSLSSSVSGAPSSRRLSAAQSSSARSRRESAVESIASLGEHGVPRMGSVISDGHRRYPSGTGYQTPSPPPRVVSPADLGRVAFGKPTIDGSASSALQAQARVSPTKSETSSRMTAVPPPPTMMARHARTESEIEMDLGAVRRVSGRWEEEEEVLPLQGLGMAQQQRGW